MEIRIRAVIVFSVWTSSLRGGEEKSRGGSFRIDDNRVDKFSRVPPHVRIRTCQQRRRRIQFEINARRKTHCSHGIVQINRSISRARRN